VRHDEVRDLLPDHLGNTGVDRDKAHEIYHDDAILEFPQSGERFLGRANIQGFRERYPAPVAFEPRELRGSGDLWIMEGRAFYNGDRASTLHFAWILEFRDGLVQHETIYFADPFAAPEWRRPWAEEGATWGRQDDLPDQLPRSDQLNSRAGTASASSL
jgi:hypothetical protein